MRGGLQQGYLDSLIQHNFIMLMQKLRITLDTKGFSLFELMISMVLIAIVSSIGIIGWQQVKEHQMLRGAISSLQYYLEQKRESAYLKNEDIVIGFKKTGQMNCFYQKGLSNQCELNLNPSLMITINHDDDQIQFYGKRNTARSLSISISNRSGKMKIIISSLGRIRECTVNQDAVENPPC